MVYSPFLTVILGDFNAKLSLWYNNNITTDEGSKSDGLTFQYGLQQIIKESTHFICSFSSCVDLIFTTQSNLLMESGLHSSLHANCHRHITFEKFSLKIPLLITNVEQIRQAISEFPWANRFANININEQAQLFIQTIQNIISNYIPHETITCDNSNPPWIDEKIKKLIFNKNRTFSANFRDRNNTDLF